MDLQRAQEAYWFISSLDKRFNMNKGGRLDLRAS